MTATVEASFRVAPAFPSFVGVAFVDTGRPPTPCEDCGMAPGNVGVYWRPPVDSMEVGLSQVCPWCTGDAVEYAVVYCAQASTVLVEVDIDAQLRPVLMPVGHRLPAAQAS